MYEFFEQNQRQMRYASGPDCTNGAANNHKKLASEKGSNIAQKAAQEAKAASEAQNIAGQQAAHQVKAQLAEKAVEAAKAAENVLTGKKVIVEELQEEVKEAQSVVQEESSSLEREQLNANAAVQAARQSQDQKDKHRLFLQQHALRPFTELKTLSHAIQTAKANAANAQAAASGVQKTLQEREELLDAARRRAEELSGQLRVAKQDLTNTNRAAAKASAAANDAKVNATRNKRRLENIRRMRVKKKRCVHGLKRS